MAAARGDGSCQGEGREDGQAAAAREWWRGALATCSCDLYKEHAVLQDMRELSLGRQAQLPQPTLTLLSSPTPLS